MVVSQRMDNATYERNAVDFRYLRTELHDGVPVEKPVMSRIHGDLGAELTIVVGSSVDRSRFRLRSNHAKLAVPGRSYFIPDVAVLPASVALADPISADLYHDPVPFVVEIWSPFTGDYDAAIKLPGYRLRGDAEI
ncbi:MAG: Uma2 family endonuclease [Chloroflexia bacterium]|nr:Uma2 family endonuclease [Chloroflexia bacterium]